MIQEVVFMLERDVELFIEHCELKGLSQKTIGSYEQTMRLFIRFSNEQGIVQTNVVERGLTASSGRPSAIERVPAYRRYVYARDVQG